MVQKEQVLKLIKDYYKTYHEKKAFTPGKDKIHYAGRVYDEDEMCLASDALLDFWLTAGKYTKAFESKFSDFLAVKNSLVVNSGSSANLIAITSLMSNQLKRRLYPGDEIITCSLAFPTTVAPIVQNRLIPVFVDARLDTYNIDEGMLKKALSKKTKALQITHTLGNPCDMDKIMKFVRENNLYLIEDTCDALGSKFNGKHVGTFGDIGTFSFYAAHHITMGEGGALAVSDARLASVIRSVRDWGRECFCGDNSGSKGACNNRFGYFIKEIKANYDHRYIYTDIGYNLKPLDVQSAIGLAQLKKLPSFIEKRKENFNKLYSLFSEYEKYFILPWWNKRSDVSWFSFPLMVKDTAPFSREELVKFLESKNIETRFIFAGNILYQPAYKNIKCRVIGRQRNSDEIMKRGFFIGVYPAIDDRHISYIKKVIREFCNRNK